MPPYNNPLFSLNHPSVAQNPLAGTISRHPTPRCSSSRNQSSTQLGHDMDNCYPASLPSNQNQPQHHYVYNRSSICLPNPSPALSNRTFQLFDPPQSVNQSQSVNPSMSLTPSQSLNPSQSVNPSHSLNPYQSINLSQSINPSQMTNPSQSNNSSSVIDQPQLASFGLPNAANTESRSTVQVYNTLPLVNAESRSTVTDDSARPPVKKPAAIKPTKWKRKVVEHDILLPPHVVERNEAEKSRQAEQKIVDDARQKHKEAQLARAKQQRTVAAPLVLDPPSPKLNSNDTSEESEQEDSDDVGEFDISPLSNPGSPTSLSIPSNIPKSPAPNQPTSLSIDIQAANENNGSAVNHTVLQTLFRLNSDQVKIAKTILEMPPEDRDAAIVYGMISLQPKPNPDESRIEVSVGSASQVSDLSLFVFGDTFKNNLRSFIRRTLMECKLETYHLEHEPVNNMVIDCSLMRMTTRWVATLPQLDKNAWLPPGFSQRNPQAVKLVHTIVHDSVKWDKGILRGCLMKNVVVNSITREVKGPIPTLIQLYAHIQQHLPHSSEFSQDVSIPTQVMVRFAYLRLATIAFNRSGSKARSAQWGPIDNQMLLFREKSADYFLSWSELILQKDHSVFGSGKQTHKQLPDDVSDMPTDIEIEKQIVVARNRRALNRSAPEPSQSEVAGSRPT